MKAHIVVGGGILGASTAYHLAKKGEDVTLIDRHDQGQATDAGAGIISPWISKRRNKAWYHLVKNGAKYYPDLIEQLAELNENDTGYVRSGALNLHHDENKLIEMEKLAYKKREDAPEMGDISRLTPKETKAYFPPLAEGYGAVHVSGGARVNGRKLRDSLLRAAEKLGAKVIKGDASLIYENNSVIGVSLKDRIIYASNVIVAGGAWTNDLLKPLGINFLVKPQKGQIIHLKLNGANNENWPVVKPPSDYYLLNFGHGHIVVGATREDDSGFDYNVTVGGLNEIFNELSTFAPGLIDSTLVETRIGFRPFTPGSLPVIGTVPNVEGLLVANGLGATGLTSGPFLGAELAKLATGDKLGLTLSDYDVAGAIQENK